MQGIKPHPLWGKSNRMVYLKHGNGCSKYADCFSCPFTDGCQAGEIPWQILKETFFYTDGLDYATSKKDLRDVTELKGCQCPA